MNPDRWRQIEVLYQAALERDAIERAAFLDEACAGDEELRLEVESLLVADEEAKKSDDFLNQNALQVAARAIAQDQKQSLLGRKIGRYQILSLLGAGGMGEVYLAQDPRLGRKLALKFLPQEFTRNQDRVQRFAREARAASALNHPNIITIHEMGEIATADGSLRYIVTEYVEGETLRQRMARAPQRRIEPSEAIDIAMQIAAALSAAHDAGITHRDIKPENVMVRPDGLVKVLDFGLAKLMTPPPETIDTDAATLAREMRTTPGMILGTLRYISPEQARGRDVDARSDIFSLGAVLYEMITGEALFAGETTADIIAAIINKEPEPLERYVREAPAELARIVRKALAKDREQRYQAAKDLLLGLKNLKLELELADKLKQTGLTATPNEAGEHQPIDEVAISALPRSYTAPAADTHAKLEPVGGAMPLDSMFYIVRGADEEFRAAIARQDSIVLIKGARQVGKTSLLARGLQQARAAGARVVLTDLQKLNAADLASAEAFYLALADLVADQLDLDVAPDAVWNARRGPSINFERYVRREALGKISGSLVWGLDEVDRLFTCSFGSEV
ncbi:MAG TPA: serine/threonine-protein kinase, partial [Blastocatellia bacterium]|nr:serine/threonine-protein kinase [Blastocatellia bacterium]